VSAQRGIIDDDNETTEPEVKRAKPDITIFEGIIISYYYIILLI
jgi:hypothetical protein